MRSSLSLTISGAIGALAALAWFRFLPMPFVGPALVVGLFCLLAVRVTASEIGKAVLVSLATIALTLGAEEAYWWRQLHGGLPGMSYPVSYLARDSLLGYTPVKRAVQRLRRTSGDSVLYDVVYTIDSLGLRISPPAHRPPPRECLLFFGDSYTIGEGVSDSETMPYRVAIRMAGRYHVYNFGVHGYGPHQMLAQLESGRVKQVLDCVPRYAFYQAIPGQVDRAAGRAGLRGPRYRLGPEGSVRRDGDLVEDVAASPAWAAYVRYQLSKSALLHVIEARIRPSDRQLFLAIVATAARMVEHEFQGCEFHIILWAQPGSPNAWMIDGLRAQGLRVHLIDEMLPELRTDPQSLRIRGDGHPNVRAHDDIAAYLAANVLRGR
jgi:hypothetical protein